MRRFAMETPTTAEPTLADLIAEAVRRLRAALGDVPIYLTRNDPYPEDEPGPALVVVTNDRETVRSIRNDIGYEYSVYSLDHLPWIYSTNPSDFESNSTYPARMARAEGIAL